MESTITNNTAVNEKKEKVGENTAAGMDLQVNPQLEIVASEIVAKKVFLNGISEYDRAVIDRERKVDLTNPVYNREVGEVQTDFGNTLYAWINEDESGNRSFAVCQKYCDGSISKELELLQADLILLAQPYEMIDEELIRDVKRLIKRTQREYLNKFSGMPNEVLHVRDIAKAVMANMMSLPQYSDCLTELERRNMHHKVVGIVKTLSSQVLDDHEKYYPISDEDLEYVSRELGVNSLVLLRKLKKYNLLFLQDSAKGYQSMVRLNGTGEGSFLAHRYCIVKDEELERCEEYSDACDF